MRIEQGRHVDIALLNTTKIGFVPQKSREI